MQKQRAIVLGVSGASGMIYAVRSLKFLLNNNYNVDLVASKAAMMVWQSENQIAMPSNLRSQEQFWREQAESQTGKLVCHQWAHVAQRSPVVPFGLWECWLSLAAWQRLLKLLMD